MQGGFFLQETKNKVNGILFNHNKNCISSNQMIQKFIYNLKTKNINISFGNPDTKSDIQFSYSVRTIYDFIDDIRSQLNTKKDGFLMKFTASSSLC